MRLTGFVVGDDSTGFRIARYQIACCAADATVAVVHVFGRAGTLPTRDEWVTVTGRLIAAGLMISGIALLGTVTATLASWFVELIRVRDADEPDEAAKRS